MPSIEIKTEQMKETFVCVASILVVLCEEVERFVGEFREKLIQQARAVARGEEDA